MTPGNPRLRALICEDEGLTVMQLRQALVKAGYTVVGEAIDGETACALASSEQPDFILMDLHLQGLNGIESTRRIMHERPTAVIVLTAYGDSDTVDQALEAGACYYLVKPVLADQLIPAIKTACARFDAMKSILQENHNLKDQLETRKLVEKAKGILMARMGLAEADAFRRMQKTSRDRCQTLKQTAVEIISADSILT